MNETQHELSLGSSLPLPMIGGAFREGWNTLWHNLPILLLIWLIYVSVGFVGILGIKLLSGSSGINNGIFSGLVSVTFSFIVSWPLFFGLCNLFLHIIRRQDYRISQIFDGFLRLPSIIFAAIMITMATTIGMLFFVVPGVIIFCKLIFTPYLLMDKDLDGWEAIALSWQMTSGYAGQIFLILVLAGLILFLGMILFGIGIIPAWIWVLLSITSLYNSLTAERASIAAH